MIHTSFIAAYSSSVFANNIPELLTFDALCEALRISPATARRYTKTEVGFPQPVRLGARRIAFRSDEIEAYVRARSGAREAQ